MVTHQRKQTLCKHQHKLMHKTICFVNINTHLNYRTIEVLIRLVGKNMVKWETAGRLCICIKALGGGEALSAVWDRCTSCCCYCMYRVTLW